MARVTTTSAGIVHFDALLAAEILESLGASATRPTDPKAPADLAYARTCYDHLAGELAVTIYRRLIETGHLSENGDEPLVINPSGLRLFAEVGLDADLITHAKRPKAKSCLDWTERRYHLAGAAGKELLSALTTNGWVRPGNRPRSMRVTESGRRKIPEAFGLNQSS